MSDEGRRALRESQQLLELAQAGYSDAAERLCRAYLPHLQRWAHGRLPRGARGLIETDDLVQDVFKVAMANLARFEYRRPGSFQFYLREGIRKRVLQEIRKTARGPLAQTWEEKAAPTASPFEELLGRERLQRFEAAYARLKPQEREAITARVELGLTYREAALVLGKPSEDAARMAIGRAMKRLLEEMSS